MIQLFRRDLVRDFFRNDPGDACLDSYFQQLLGNFCPAGGCYMYEPVTWVTDLTGHIGNTF
ncbi:hypothetical protein ABW06_19200 [Pluralibacter gergoviae]|uniref:Uncharacterized protein n=1 Tax=Pluralibacter gergoviae TaxID=61647 RepID=A0A0J5M8A4_PLUGE|nr:hypothetical protein ABW06_19200 [Pluralibacter gergoviae]KMK26439.1 hypothetical protein ABW10_02970 [Pluralibacter gergoviae]